MLSSYGDRAPVQLIGISMAFRKGHHQHLSMLFVWTNVVNSMMCGGNCSIDTRNFQNLRIQAKA